MKRVVLLEKCPDGKTTIENWFVDLFSDMEIKYIKELYPNIVFLFKNGKCLFRHNYENDMLYIHYDKVWFIFKTKFNLKYSETRILIKSAVEKYFKIKVSKLELNNLTRREIT